jgi:hypothetical protein
MLMLDLVRRPHYRSPRLRRTKKFPTFTAERSLDPALFDYVKRARAAAAAGSSA